MRPKLLIISFHYPPMGVVAAERAKAWAEQLSQLNWEVDVLTHHWDHNGEKWTVSTKEDEIIQAHDNLRVIRLKLEEPETNELSPTRRKLKILKDWFSGRFDPLPIANAAYEKMKTWADREINADSYNLIMGIYSPHQHLRLCYEIHKRTKIPFHLDFRDLWDNMLLKDDYRPNTKQLLHYFCIKFYWRKWLKKASGVSSVSPAIIKYLESKFRVGGLSILTGYDPTRLPEQLNETDQFLLLYTGSFYKHQHYRAMLEGIRIFLEQHPDNEIRVAFHGIIRKENIITHASYTGRAAEEVNSILKDKRVFCGPRIPQEQVRKIQTQAQVLLMPTFKGVPGIISGKVQEYLGTGKRILAIPRDKDAIGDLLKQSGAGLCVDEAEEFAAILSDWYSEWKEHKVLKPITDLSKRESFSQSETAWALGEFLGMEL